MSHPPPSSTIQYVWCRTHHQPPPFSLCGVTPTTNLHHSVYVVPHLSPSSTIQYTSICGVAPTTFLHHSVYIQFPLFLKRTADVMAPRLSVVFRRLVRLGSFSACWRQANVTPIPKRPPSSSVANYRPIFIT